MEYQILLDNEWATIRYYPGERYIHHTFKLVLLPYLDSDKEWDRNVTGIWLRSRRGRHLALIGTTFGTIWTAGMILLNEYWLDLPELLDFLPTSISNGLIPLVFIVLVLISFHRIVRARGATVSEANLALFSLLFAVFVTLTVIGVYFWGENMALMLPWDM